MQYFQFPVTEKFIFIFDNLKGKHQQFFNAYSYINIMCWKKLSKKIQNDECCDIYIYILQVFLLLLFLLFSSISFIASINGVITKKINNNEKQRSHIVVCIVYKRDEEGKRAMIARTVRMVFNYYKVARSCIFIFRNEKNHKNEISFRIQNGKFFFFFSSKRNKDRNHYISLKGSLV